MIINIKNKDLLNTGRSCYAVCVLTEDNFTQGEPEQREWRPTDLGVA